MKKVIISVIAVLILVAVVFAGCSSANTEAGENLLFNGNFESGLTNGWTIIKDSSYSVTPSNGPSYNQGADGYGVSSKVNGTTTLSLDTSSKSTYCYLTQAVSVEKDTYYKLSAIVSIKNKLTVAQKLGAYIGISENSAVYVSKDATTDGFVTLEVYFRNVNADKVNVRLGLGNENNKVKGAALFDNIKLEKLESAPVGVNVLDVVDNYNMNYNNETTDLVYLVLTVCLAGILAYVGSVIIRRKMVVNKGGELLPEAKKGKSFAKITLGMLAVLLVGFGIRLVLVLTAGGDIASSNSFGLMASKLAELGPVKYYSSYWAESTPTVAPGMMYVLWIFGLIAKGFGLGVGSTGLAVFLKIPAIIADLVAIFLIFNLVVNDERYTLAHAVVFALMYALMPIVFAASSLWNSAFSLGALFLLVTFMAVLKKKHIATTIWYTLAVLFMPEALLVAPILIAYCVYIYVKDASSRIVLPICAVAAFIGGYLVTLPFAIDFFALGNPFVILVNYCKYFTVSNLFTEGAFNIYGLFNLAGLTVNTAAVVCSAILGAIILILAVLAYLKCRNRLDIMLISATAIILIYTLCAKMSVWFMFPALILLLVYGIHANEGRVLGIFLGYGLLGAINTGYYLFINGFISSGINADTVVLPTGSDPVLIIFSILSVILAGYLTFVTVRIINGHKYNIPAIDKPYCEFLKGIFTKKTKKSEIEE